MVDDQLVPSSVRNRLAYEYKRNTMQMLKLCGEMEQVSQLFNKENIRLLFLKGPHLGHELYGDLSLRTSHDLDILVPPEDFDKAEKLLLEAGYENDNPLPTVLNSRRWREHHGKYFHPEKKMIVEIHWRLNPPPSKDPTFEELWERKQLCSFSHHPLFMLGEEDLYMFLIKHGARHGWFRLRWLLDIQQLIQKQEADKQWKSLFLKKGDDKSNCSDNYFIFRSI